MYRTFTCPYCLKVFYIENSGNTHGEMMEDATKLYDAIMKHMDDYNHNYKEYTMDNDPRDVEIWDLMQTITEIDYPDANMIRVW